MLTGVPNHPEGVIHPDYVEKPGFLREMLGGIAVWRHSMLVAPNRGKWNRLWSQLSFMGSLLWANWRTTDCVPKVVLASSPTFFPALAGWLLARRYGAKFVFEVRDLWPAIFVQMGLFKAGSLPVRVMECLEMFLYKRADAIVTVTRSFADNIVARGVPATKLHVVFNGVSEHDLDRALAAREASLGLRQALGLGTTTKVVLYIGNHGEAQALGQVVDAARLMMKRTDVVFVFVGQGADKARLVDYAKGVPNVKFLPGVSHDAVWTYYAMADINLVCLKNIPEFSMFIPSKMFEIMAAQSCAVAALQGEGADIMQESGCALVVPSEDSEKLAAAIGTLVDEPERRQAMAAAGRAYVEQHFGHDDLAARYGALLEKLVGR